MTYNELWRQLAQIYNEGEAKAIARMTYEERFGLTLSDIYLGKETQLSAADQTELQFIAKRLLQGEPIQYVLGQTYFCGRQFMVNEHVLIPRPETEELCQWILAADLHELTQAVRCRPLSSAAEILDIGTGSGCIAITLAAEMPQAEVTAWDISAEALKVAAENARRHNVSVSFEQVDVLNVQCSMFNGISSSAIRPIYVIRNARRWRTMFWNTNRIRPSLCLTTTRCCSIGLLPNMDNLR